MDSHSGATMCHVCQKILSRKSHLTRHLQTVHRIPPPPSQGRRKPRFTLYEEGDHHLNFAAQLNQSANVQNVLLKNETEEEFEKENGKY